jgi:hypothetical protein
MVPRPSPPAKESKIPIRVNPLVCSLCGEYNRIIRARTHLLTEWLGTHERKSLKSGKDDLLAHCLCILILFGRNYSIHVVGRGLVTVRASFCAHTLGNVVYLRTKCKGFNRTISVPRQTRDGKEERKKKNYFTVQHSTVGNDFHG